MWKALAFPTLSKFVAIVIILLVVYPVTAPFSTFDFAMVASQVHETLDGDAKSSIATPAALPNFVPVAGVETALLHHPTFVWTDGSWPSVAAQLRL